MPLPQTGYPRYPHAIIIIIVISIYFKKDNIIILECGKKTLILSSTGSLRSHPGFPGYPDIPVLPDDILDQCFQIIFPAADDHMVL